MTTFNVGAKVRCINARGCWRLEHGRDYVVNAVEEALGQSYVGLEGVSETTAPFFANRFELVKDEALRTFGTGAIRNADTHKVDYEGFLSPNAIRSFAAYMHKHCTLPDGTRRASDNWKQGIPTDAYMKSMFRHFMDVWTIHSGGTAKCSDTGETLTIEEALNALKFNVDGYLHEATK